MSIEACDRAMGWRFGALALALALVVTMSGPAFSAEQPPKVGDAAAEFTLKALDGKTVSLKNANAEGPVVLVVLRGYPGYQCPLCTEQVAGLMGKAKDFQAAGARVLMVYPGPADELAARAAEFLGPNKDLPEPFTLLLDPDFAFLEAYGLRWDAQAETSYPSAFVIDGQGKVRFAKVSKTHGGRASTDELLAALGKLGR